MQEYLLFVYYFFLGYLVFWVDADMEGSGLLSVSLFSEKRFTLDRKKNALVQLVVQYVFEVNTFW